MSHLLKGFKDWARPSPSPRKPDTAGTDDAIRGTKRKADPYDDLEDGEDDPPVITPSSRVRPRVSSEAPSSSRSARPTSANKIKRRSRSLSKRPSSSSSAPATSARGQNLPRSQAQTPAKTQTPAKAPGSSKAKTPATNGDVAATRTSARKAPGANMGNASAATMPAKGAPEASADDEPAEDEPAEDEPAEDEPAEDEPAGDEPAEDEPTGDEPVAEAPDATTSAAEASADAPIAETTTGKPARKAAAGKAAAGKAAAGKAAAGKAAAGKAAAGKAAAGKPAAEKPAVEKATPKTKLVARGKRASLAASASKRSAEQDAEEPAAAAPEAEADDLHEVERLLKYRRLPNGSIELLVKWVDEPETDATYEPEEEIQNGAAETLYDFWKKQGGRTETLFYKGKNPPAEQYFAFKILNHEKVKTIFQFEVQWVGYPDTPGNTSWEPESKLKKSAPAMLQEYWESQGGREKFLARRGRAKQAKN